MIGLTGVLPASVNGHLFRPLSYIQYPDGLAGLASRLSQVLAGFKSLHGLAPAYPLSDFKQAQ